jgi:hypothetical protein
MWGLVDSIMMSIGEDISNGLGKRNVVVMLLVKL